MNGDGAASEGFDGREARPQEQRRHDLMEQIGATVAAARQRSAFWRERLTDAPVDPARFGMDDLAALPILRKSDLPQIQAGQPPFGGLTDLAPGDFPHLFLSPGPICEPAPRRPDGWNVARALHAAGLRAGDVVLNTFGYHLTPAGLFMDDGARRLGCAVIPAGGGNTEAILQAMRAYAPSAFIGTADYLNILLAAADRAGVAVALRRAVVSGAAVPASLRTAFGARGIEVFELYGTAELGIVAYETRAHAGFVVNEDILVELLDPQSGRAVAEGEVGEVVVTLPDPDYPLIRFATGDLSAALPGPSPCGRSNLRLRGWMGRADEAVKVKGMFLRPGQLAEVLARGEGLVTRARFVVERADERDVLRLEAEGAGDAAATARLVDVMREVTRLGGTVGWCPPGSLPDGGPAIVDRRKLD